MPSWSPDLVNKLISISISYAHKRTYTYSHIYEGVGVDEREHIHISGDSSPICKRHLESMLKGIKSYLCLVQTTNHREIFTTYLTSECQNFQNLDDKCKLIWILNNEDPTILRYLCQYLLSTTICAKKNIFFLMLNAGGLVCRSPIPFNQIVVDKRY
jgi:hypothetical protein